MANAGGDITNATKQANEFGLTHAGQTVVSLLTFITDVNSVGLKAAQGLTFVTAFYWDRDDESRAWSKRFFEFHKRKRQFTVDVPESVIQQALTCGLLAPENGSTVASGPGLLRRISFRPSP